MTLDELGWGNRPEPSPPTPTPGDSVDRVAVEHRSSYVVYAEAGELTAEVSGKLRHDAEKGLPPGLPAVGDWVALRPRPGESKATIQAVLPRHSLFVRKEAGRRTTAQVVAANIDVVFLVSALTNDLNPRRVERYLTLAWESGAEPVVVLNKADLCADPEGDAHRIGAVAPGVPVHVVSTLTGLGLEELDRYFHHHRTVALLGSSGVGKSTLINRLVGRDLQKVQEVRDDGKGRHTTTRRELVLRPGGGLLLDTPGMRELQLWEGGEGVQSTFVDVEELATRCRFTDCAHQTEPGCAVRAAVADGSLPPERLESYRKLQGEIRHLEAKQDTGIAREKKQRERAIHRTFYKFYKRLGKKWG
jgi:ribosome biogenesis GTPase